jgi:hypothetical protein
VTSLLISKKSEVFICELEGSVGNSRKGSLSKFSGEPLKVVFWVVIISDLSCSSSSGP